MTTGISRPKMIFGQKRKLVTKNTTKIKYAAVCLVIKLTPKNIPTRKYFLFCKLKYAAKNKGASNWSGQKPLPSKKICRGIKSKTGRIFRLAAKNKSRSVRAITR